MNITPELLLQLVVTLITGAGVYSQIRTDIVKLSERVQGLRDTVESHEQHIDKLRDRRVSHGG